MTVKDDLKLGSIWVIAFLLMGHLMYLWVDCNPMRMVRAAERRQIEQSKDFMSYMDSKLARIALETIEKTAIEAKNQRIQQIYEEISALAAEYRVPKCILQDIYQEFNAWSPEDQLGYLKTENIFELQCDMFLELHPELEPEVVVNISMATFDLIEFILMFDTF